MASLGRTAEQIWRGPAHKRFGRSSVRSRRPSQLSQAQRHRPRCEVGGEVVDVCSFVCTRASAATNVPAAESRHRGDGAGSGVPAASCIAELIDPAPSRHRDLVCAMLAATVIAPASKLATARGLRAETATSSLGAVLGVAGCDEDDLYAAMDWVLERQDTIEDALATLYLAMACRLIATRFILDCSRFRCGRSWGIRARVAASKLRCAATSPQSSDRRAVEMFSRSGGACAAPGIALGVPVCPSGCGCIRVSGVGFGQRPRGNTDDMSRAVRVVAAAAASTLGAVAARDLFQRKHALLRNFPLLGQARYLIEAIGPELRQYIVAANNEERPFTRDQRSVGARLGEEAEQLLRVRHRQRPGIHGRLSGDQASHLRSGHTALGADGRARGRVAMRQGDRCRASPAGGIPAEIRGQHLGDELRVTVQQRHRGPQPGRRAGRLPAQHR